jgi:bifunctional DNA-binding transcriptional regulator/antitoxin component of YhaV-PrlF toxin-antitoxin module
MLVKITSKRRVTFPKHVLDALGVGPGDLLDSWGGLHPL